jgi:DNA polymerase/3'-5' exonuclease PolX
MFGEPTGGTVSDLDCLVADLGVVFTKNGPKYKQFTWQGMPVDLFVTTPPQWGLIATIRTGPSAFSQRLVTPRRRGGLLPSHLRVKDGWLWQDGQQVPTPEEADFFAALGIDWIDPWERH